MESKRLKRSRCEWIASWLGGMGLLLMGTRAIAAQPEAAPPAQSSQSALGARLAQMFSPEIQSMLSACAETGGVNLAASASSGSSLTCGDGSTVDASYATYLNTASNFFAASLLLGMSQAATEEPRLTPMMASTFFAGEGSSVLRQGLQNAIVRSTFVSANSSASVDLLINAIVQQATDTLGGLESFSALLGTPEQSSFVLANFCASPGMSVAQAQDSVPQLRPAQLYAICLNEAGLSGELGSGELGN